MHASRPLLGCTLLTVFLLGPIHPAAALERTDVVRRDFALTARGGRRAVVIDNVFGSVRVRAGGGERVVVESRRAASARRAADLEAAFREVTLTVDESAGRLELSQDGPFRCHDGSKERRHWGGCDWDPDYELRWEWQVTAPADVDLEVSTVNDGDIDVAGIEGRVEAENVNGELKLVGLVGEVEASTVNGDLTVEYARAPEIDSSFETVNGEIELTLPAASEAELGVETMNGEIFTGFEVVSLPQRAEPTRHGQRGRRYELERDTVLRIGAGGPRLDLETLNGDIVVRAR